MSSTLNEGSTPPSEDDISKIIVNKVNSEGNTPGVGFNDGNPYGTELEFVIKQQFVNSLQQNREERVKYAKHTFWLTCIWIFIVIAFILLSSLSYQNKKILVMSDNVLIMLISTTTLNVFGFFLLVMQFLFNKEELAALSFLFNNKNETSKAESTKK